MNPQEIFEETESGWIFSNCCLCKETNGDDFLHLKHYDAPAGTSHLRKCCGCGLIRLWPRPGMNVITTYYPSDSGAYIGRRRSVLKQAVWDFIRDVGSGAPGRGRNLSSFRPLFKMLAEWIFDINVSLERDPLPSIIDIGCGFGDLLLYWKSRGAKTLGVDFSEKAVKMGESLGLRILHGELTQQKLPSGSFDVAILNHSLEHVPHPVAILQEVARILRPGGTVHIVVPNGAGAGFEIYKDSWQCLIFPLHFWFFDSNTLSQALQTTGFHKVRIRTSNIYRGYFANYKLAPFSHLPKISYRLFLLFVRTIGKKYRGEILRVVAVKK